MTFCRKMHCDAKSEPPYVDQYVKGVSAILSQKDGRIEMVVVYASKNLFDVQKRFHPMEGECYEVVWGANYTFDNIYIKHSFC